MQTIFKPSEFPIQFLYGVHFTKNKPDVAYLIEEIESVLKRNEIARNFELHNIYISILIKRYVLFEYVLILL